MTAPPAGAGRVSVTVPVLAVPPVTTVGFKAIAANAAAGGLTVSVAVLTMPPNVEVIVTAVGVVTALVTTGKVALVAVAETVTEAGTVAALVLLLASVTTAPAGGAGEASFTVPVLPAPPATKTGFNEREAPEGLTTSVTALLAPL